MSESCIHITFNYKESPTGNHILDSGRWKETGIKSSLKRRFTANTDGDQDGGAFQADAVIIDCLNGFEISAICLTMLGNILKRNKHLFISISCQEGKISIWNKETADRLSEVIYTHLTDILESFLIHAHPQQQINFYQYYDPGESHPANVHKETLKQITLLTIKSMPQIYRLLCSTRESGDLSHPTDDKVIILNWYPAEIREHTN